MQKRLGEATNSRRKDIREKCMRKIHKMASVSSIDSRTNFERLLQTLSPAVRSKEIPKSYVEGLNKAWNPVCSPITRYFRLGDLWKSFEECSACGVGAKIENHDSEPVMHYYVPKLSVLQIFTYKPFEELRIPNLKDIDDISEVEAELWSDESDGEKSWGSASNSSSKAWEVTADDLDNDNEDPPPFKRNFRNLYFGLQEPLGYNRVPLFERIQDLAVEHPGLLTLKSTDLTPASWMAISWYPIYQIPPQEVKDDMTSPFLTFHTLSSFLLDNAEDTANKENGHSDAENIWGVGSKSISLPPFGIASYKLNGDVWFSSGESDYAKFYDLHSAADSWLKQVDFNHYDYKFFNRKADHECKANCRCRHFGSYHKDFF